MARYAELQGPVIRSIGHRVGKIEKNQWAQGLRTSRTHMVASPCFRSPDCLADLKIVVVEDHDDARRYLDLFLGQLGAKVRVARNAFEGLEAIKNTHPDLVLSDIKMPGMDGFELLDQIRALRSDAGGSVPVIAMSAFFSQTDRQHVHEADFQACLPKPFTPDKLVETILGIFEAALEPLDN
jgi:CheY-like chemotaxis protein